MSHENSGRHSLASDALFSAIAQAAALLTTFLVGLLASRTLGPAGKGELALLNQLTWFGYMALNLGIGSSTAYAVGRGRKTAGEGFSDCLLLTGLTALLGAPAIVLAGSLVPSLSGVGALPLLLAAAALPLTLMNAYSASIAVGTHIVRRLALTQVVTAAITLAVVVSLFAAGELAIAAILMVQSVSLTLSVVSLGHGIRSSTGSLLVRPSLHRLRAQTTFASRAYLADLTTYLSLRLDTLLLGVLSTAASVGIYSVGVAFAELLWFLPNSLAQALFSKSLRTEAAAGAASAAAACRTAVMLMTTLWLTLSAVLTPLVAWLYGSDFAQASQVFVVLGPGVILLGAGRTLQNYLTAHAKLLPGIALGASAMNLVGNLFAIPAFGILGAATVSAVTYSVAGLLIAREFRKLTGTPVHATLVPRIGDAKELVVRLRNAAARRERTG